MQFDPPLQPARLVRRYKRFLADMILDDGREIVAHCPNPGSMMGLAAPGSRLLARRPKTAKGRKLDFGWESVGGRGPALVGINTGYANRIVAEGLAAGRHSRPAARRRLAAGSGVRRRHALRFRPYRRPDGALTYLEVKSVTLSRKPGRAEFPGRQDRPRP